MTIDTLISQLEAAKATLMVIGDNTVNHYTQRGIQDIYTLFKQSPQVLKGATIVDKIIGKGAASVMIAARPQKVYTRIISQNALQFFNQYNIPVEYKELVPHIIRRDGNGWCPVELLCKEATTVEQAMLKIDEFMNQIKS
ncbi:MAG: DUF1893 domain-containing protein [Rikenellaceae bacterium]